MADIAPGKFSLYQQRIKCPLENASQSSFIKGHWLHVCMIKNERKVQFKKRTQSPHCVFGTTT